MGRRGCRSRLLLSSQLLERCIEEKDFDRAHDLLNQVADEQGYFPYGDATRLIEALPPEREGDRQALQSEWANDRRSALTV